MFMTEVIVLFSSLSFSRVLFDVLFSYSTNFASKNTVECPVITGPLPDPRLTFFWCLATWHMRVQCSPSCETTCLAPHIIYDQVHPARREDKSDYEREDVVVSVSLVGLFAFSISAELVRSILFQ